MPGDQAPAPATPAAGTQARSDLTPHAGPDRRRSGPPPVIRQASRRSTDDSIKETFESVVIAFILTFIFRAFIMEAFVIPTGSMAPTLLGQHIDATCPQCGYGFPFDESGRTHLARAVTAPCPMCFYRVDTAALTPTRSGDRLLVQKYLYEVVEPNRWDVIVFRNPQAINREDQSPGPTTNYIKRLVGLPHEELTLFGGNVYVRPLARDAPSDAPRDAPPDAPWRIARKTDPAANPRWEKIQREVWRPVYHSRYRPRDGGVRESDGRRVRGTPWSCPWVPERAAHWRTDAPDPGYRFAATAASARPAGRLQFDWNLYPDPGVYYPYNLTIARRGIVRGQPIEDIRLAATLAPETEGVSLALNVSARLETAVDAGDQTLTVTLEPDGVVSLTSVDPARSAPPDLLAQTNAAAPGPGRAVRLELWFVDAEAIVFVDGDLALRHAFDRPLDQIKLQRPVNDRPALSLEVRGGPATVHDVQVDRDLYHTSHLVSTEERAPVGAIYRDFRGVIHETPPVRLPADRFFVLGDNGPISNDARFWSSIEPWLEKNLYGTHPAGPGVPDYVHHVPRSMLVGRAFFVYWPSPFPFAGDQQPIIPNFGSMRPIY